MPNTDTMPQMSPLNFIAEAYWEDFIKGHPIDGGVLNESELRACHLDDSVESLQQIDTLLDKVQTENKMRPDLFMQQSHSRNLVLFIGFYMGRVLTKVLENQGEWIGQAELERRYPDLGIHPNNPFHFMALNLATESSTLPYNDTTLFFVLEPIAIKVFGDKLKMRPVVGSHIAPSLFNAVVERLPDDVRAQVLAVSPPVVEHQQVEPKFPVEIKRTETSNNSDNTLQQNNESPYKEVIHIIPQTPATIIETNDTETMASKTTATKVAGTKTPAATQSNKYVNSKKPSILDKDNTTTPSSDPIMSNQAVKTTTLPISDVTTRIDQFKELRTELVHIDVDQRSDVKGSYHEMYLRASKVLAQVDKLMAQSSAALQSVTLPHDVVTFRQKAIVILKKASEAGHTGAMLRLSIFKFLGEGVDKNETEGFKLTEQAANLGDIRGIRQLSRLYYAGLGCQQDIALGKLKLELAASSGHKEAAQLLQNWDMGETLIEEKNSDESLTKKTLIMFGVTLFVLMFVFIIVSNL